MVGVDKMAHQRLVSSMAWILKTCQNYSPQNLSVMPCWIITRISIRRTACVGLVSKSSESAQNCSKITLFKRCGIGWGSKIFKMNDCKSNDELFVLVPCWDRGRLEKTTIDIPVLFIQAINDPALPFGMSAGIGKYIPRLTIKRVKSSHWALWERPADVNQIIKEWLQKHNSQSSRSLLWAYSRTQWSLPNNSISRAWWGNYVMADRAVWGFLVYFDLQPGVRLYSGHYSRMGANSSCLSDSTIFVYYSMISICHEATVLDTPSILVSYIFRAWNTDRSSFQHSC